MSKADKKLHVFIGSLPADVMPHLLPVLRQHVRRTAAGRLVRWHAATGTATPLNTRGQWCALMQEVATWYRPATGRQAIQTGDNYMPCPVPVIVAAQYRKHLEQQVARFALWPADTKNKAG